MLNLTQKVTVTNQAGSSRFGIWGYPGGAASSGRVWLPLWTIIHPFTARAASRSPAPCGARPYSSGAIA